MQVSVEKTSELSRKMTVSLPEDVVQEKMTERLKSLARDAKVDGFRPGKAPQQVIKKLYGERVRQEVAGDLIQTTLSKALQDQNLKPAGYPQIQLTEEVNGFGYIAEFEVYPEIALDNIGQLEVIKPISSVQESDVDGMILKLREQRKTWEVADRLSQKSDRVTITFSGVSDGENFTDGKVENYQVEIGSKRMIPGFEDQLIGLKAGDNKTFEIAFPEKYGNEKLAGKLAQFDVEVSSIEESILPEIDADFIKAYGIEDGSEASFRQDVKENMQRELERALRGKLKNSLMDALYEKIKINIPNVLVDQEIESLMQPYIENAKKRKLKIEDLNLPRDNFEDQAKRRVALGLILGEIIRKNDIKLDAEKVRSTIEDMAKSYERPADVVNWYYSDESRLADVQQLVLEDQTVEWLASQVKVSEQELAFSDVLGQEG
ncbi:MAG: trigger factor [Methylococcaceae bacterium]|nr:trigger factor [Methylococcaceae bacterium]MDP3905021.1 trigger factor [Methylococcaceae bacterium]